jgi:hypothetical protein
VADAAKVLGTAPSTLHRLLNDGFIAGEQLTPATPWRIRLAGEVRTLFVDDAPKDWLVIQDATNTLRASPPDRVAACQARRTRCRARPCRVQKGLRIRVPDAADGLF